jgi:hypothetical protein
VFLEPEWLLSRDLSSVIYHYNNNPQITHDKDALKEIARRSASKNNEQGGVLSQYLWNNPTIGVNKILDGSKGLSTQLTDYYTVRSTSGRFNHELYKKAYEHDLSPNASISQIRKEIEQMSFPYRDRSYGNSTIIESDNPFLLGQTTITIFKTEEGLYYPLEYRNNRVTESPGWKNIIPTGVIQPEPLPDEDLEGNYQSISLRDIVYRKATSELFNKDYSVAELKEDASENKLVYKNLGYGIDAVNSHIHLYNLLYVQDTQLSEKLLSKITQAWSSEYISIYDLSNKYQLQDILSEQTVIPYNIPAIVESLLYLQSEYSVDLPINVSRTL